MNDLMQVSQTCDQQRHCRLAGIARGLHKHRFFYTEAAEITKITEHSFAFPAVASQADV